jgi:hypothetical protein
MVPGEVNPWPGYEGRQTRNEVDRFEGYLRRPVAVGCLSHPSGRIGAGRHIRFIRTVADKWSILRPIEFATQSKH